MARMGLYILFIGGLFHAAMSVCPDGFCRHSGGCYLVVNMTVSWIDARSYCPLLNAVLFSPTSSTMQTAVEGALVRSAGTIHPGKFWLDFTDLINPKDFKRMSDRVSLSYTNWSTKDATDNSSTFRNCVYMSADSDYKWNTASCSEQLNFICYSSGLKKQVQRQIYYNRYRSTVEYDEVDVEASEVSWKEFDC